MFRPYTLRAACIAAFLVAAAVAAPPIDPELALEAPAVLSIKGNANYSDTQRAWQGIPGIERTPGGRLWSTWYTGGTGEGPLNYVVIARSDDDGATWGEPELAVDPTHPVRTFDPCLWTDPQGRLWLFWAQSAGLWDGRGGVWAIVSDDPDAAQPKWSKPRRIFDGVMMNKPTVLSNGDWLLPVSGWRFKPPRIQDGLERMGYDAPAEGAKLWARSPGDRGGSMVIASSDQGKSFHYRGQALLEHPQHDEHMVVERKDGSLWMLIRTTYGIGEGVSRDGGTNWSHGGPTGIPHPVTRFHIRRLRSGRLLMVRNVPDADNPKLRTDMTAFLSDDDGLTWKGGLLLDGRNHVSYPDMVESDDGTLYIIYDRERGDAKEILLARIAEQDILAGKLVGNSSKLQLLVNIATGKR